MKISAFFALIGFLILGFGLISERLQKSIITPPMVFTTVGLIVGSPMLRFLSLEPESEVIRSFEPHNSPNCSSCH